MRNDKTSDLYWAFFLPFGQNKKRKSNNMIISMLRIRIMVMNQDAFQDQQEEGSEVF